MPFRYCFLICKNAYNKSSEAVVVRVGCMLLDIFEN